jgi:hypothetical protein
VPGGFRLDYSRLGIDTVLLSDEQAAIVRMLDENPAEAVQMAHGQAA